MVIPNLAKLKSYAGRSDHFVMQLGVGYSAGFGGLYGGTIAGYIWERHEVNGFRRRGEFRLTLLGFGIGIALHFPTNHIDIDPPTRRNIEHFQGFGRLSFFGASYSVIGASCGEMQMPEGTIIPVSCSFGPSISSGPTAGSLVLGGVVSLVYFELMNVDKI